MGKILLALRRAREPILWMAMANMGGIAVGMVFVHAGYPPAIRYRDRLVGTAVQTSSIMKAQERELPLKAALLDFAANTGLAAVPSTVMGLSVVMPFPVALARGFVGGVVSIDGEHHSRLANGHEALYYLIVLILQVIPYALAGGAGVRLGLALIAPRSRWGVPDEPHWFGLPREGVLDVLRIYALVLPLFLFASLVEFLAR